MGKEYIYNEERYTKAFENLLRKRATKEDIQEIQNHNDWINEKEKKQKMNITEEKNNDY